MTESGQTNLKLFNLRPVLGVDYGTKVTGLAYFCPGREPFPLPYGEILYRDDLDLAKKIRKIADEECIELIVLGLPLFTDGKESEMTARVRNFASLLQAEIAPIEFRLQDETLTSFEAADRMKNSPQYNYKVDESKIDSLAASIILEDFFKN